ncbi:DUF1648 domain-containing protein [Streptomyces sp. NPDC048603]|uniref:DUF1648 domain-containing protein n=1 Tax=Streptomyces sp. NPDC048603 TaxID=3365577 RepID=UPI00371DC03F
MGDRPIRKNAVRWGAGLWAVGVLATVTCLPWAVRPRLPERLATHWGGGSGGPDDSMPFWAAAFLPGLIWAVLVLVVLLVRWRAGAGASVRSRAGAAAALLSGGVFLAGAQACVVLANLDHADWREADSPTVWAVAAGLSAALAGLAGWLGVARGRAR